MPQSTRKWDFSDKLCYGRVAKHRERSISETAQEAKPESQDFLKRAVFAAGGIALRFTEQVGWLRAKQIGLFHSLSARGGRRRWLSACRSVVGFDAR